MIKTVSCEPSHCAGIPTETIDRIAAERRVRPSYGISRSARRRHRQKLGLKVATIAVSPQALVAAGFLSSDDVNDRHAINAAAEQALRRVIDGSAGKDNHARS